MIRIYLTNSGIEGYHEGCSCCSFTEHATVKDIRKLCDKLENQKQLLFMLLELLDDHTEDEIVYWYKTYEEIQYLEASIQAGQKYKDNPRIQGTFYKESYEKMEANTKELSLLKKKYSKFPSVFRKYIKEKER